MLMPKSLYFSVCCVLKESCRRNESNQKLLRRLNGYLDVVNVIFNDICVFEERNNQKAALVGNAAFCMFYYVFRREIYVGIFII